MKKPEIIEKLTELGVEHDSDAPKHELEELLKENTPEGGDDEDEDEDGDEDPKGTEKKGEVTAVTVYAADKTTVRSYTAERHGEEFAELAEEFATQNEGYAVGPHDPNETR